MHSNFMCIFLQIGRHNGFKLQLYRKENPAIVVSKKTGTCKYFEGTSNFSIFYFHRFPWQIRLLYLSKYFLLIVYKYNVNWVVFYFKILFSRLCHQKDVLCRQNQFLVKVLPLELIGVMWGEGGWTSFLTVSKPS